jgi:hypothetical protein
MNTNEVRTHYNDEVRGHAVDDFAHQLTAYFLDMGLFRSCLNCEHWIKEGAPLNPETCGLYKSRPPARIIVTGCESHSDNIPF